MTSKSLSTEGIAVCFKCKNIKNLSFSFKDQDWLCDYCKQSELNEGLKNNCVACGQSFSFYVGFLYGYYCDSCRDKRLLEQGLKPQSY